MKNISSKNNNEIINNKLEALYDFFEKNNITKLKDSSWFNETVYVKDGKYISSGKGKNDFYTIDTIGVEAKKRRIWPEY